MHEATRSEGPELIVTTLRRRLGLIISCLILGVTAGWLYAKTLTPTFTGTASVLVNPLEGNPYAPSDRSDDLTRLETEAQIVSSDPVLREVASRAEGGVTPAGLESKVGVIVPPNTQILEIRYEDADAQVARDTASAFASAYLDLRQQRAEQTVEGQVASIDNQLEQALTDLQAATTAARQDDESRAFNVELARALNTEIINLRAQRFAIQNAQPGPGRVISPAALTTTAADSVRPLIFSGLGALGGLALGLGLGMLLERRHGRVWGPAEVKSAGIPVLAVLSHRRRGRRAAQAESDLDEAIRRVRAAVLDMGSHVIVAVSGLPLRDAVVAPALARSLARAGRRVILVDTVGRATQEAGAGSLPGLTDLLSGHSGQYGDLLVRADDDLRLLPRGDAAIDVADLFLQDKLADVVEPMRAGCDVLVIAAPDLHSTQGEALVRASDATVLVVAHGKARRAELEAVMEWADRAEAHILGAVLLPGNLTSSPASRLVLRRAAETGTVPVAVEGSGTPMRSGAVNPAADSDLESSTSVTR